MCCKGWSAEFPVFRQLSSSAGLSVFLDYQMLDEMNFAALIVIKTNACKTTRLSLSLTLLLPAALHKHFLCQIPVYVTYIQETGLLLLYSSCLCWFRMLFAVGGMEHDTVPSVSQKYIQ
jgi:hypothetical protein